MEKEEVRKVRVRNALTFQLEPSDVEPKSDLPSETVPNEALGIREIMARFTRGQGSGVSVRKPQFDEGADFDSEDIEKLPDLDLVERDEFAASNLEKKERLEEELRQQKEERDRKAQELAQEDEELRKELRERRKKGKDKGIQDITPLTDEAEG